MSKPKTRKGSYKPFAQWKKDLQRRGLWEERGIEGSKPRSTRGSSRSATRGLTEEDRETIIKETVRRLVRKAVQ